MNEVDKKLLLIGKLMQPAFKWIIQYLIKQLQKIDFGTWISGSDSNTLLYFP